MHIQKHFVKQKDMIDSMVDVMRFTTFKSRAPDCQTAEWGPAPLLYGFFC